MTSLNRDQRQGTIFDEMVGLRRPIRLSGGSAIINVFSSGGFEGTTMFARQFHCHDCGSDEGYRSRPKTFMEKYVLPAVGMKPVRCADCFRRTYEWVFVQARERHQGAATHRAAA
jgi:hypothetical protein